MPPSLTISAATASDMNLLQQLASSAAIADLIRLACAAAAGLCAGWACAAAVCPARYRLPEERALPPRATRWPPLTLAVAFTVTTGALWARHGPVPTAVYLAAATWLACLAIVDLDVHRLPDALTLPAYIGVPGALAACSFTGSSPDPAALPRALGAGLALGGLYLATYAVGRHRGGLGLGDVKLAAPLGMLLGWLGWATLAAGAYAGFVISGLTGAATLVRRRGNRYTPHAHGPAMALGALVGILLTG